MTRQSSTIAVGMLTLALAGCVVGHYDEGNRFDIDKVQLIRPGVTTKREIVEWFGPPQNYSNPSMLYELFAEVDVDVDSLNQYQFSDILVYQFHKGRGKAVLLLLFNFAEMRVKTNSLIVFFDDDEKVQYYGFHEGIEK